MTEVVVRGEGLEGVLPTPLLGGVGLSVGEGERAVGEVTEGLMDTGSCGEVVVLVCRGEKERGKE